MAGEQTASRKKKARTGFTLTEILVVLAIVVILATLILTAVIRSMKRAEEVEDVSDTRQDNITTLIDVTQSGKGYDGLPEHLKEGRFGDEK